MGNSTNEEDEVSMRKIDEGPSLLRKLLLEQYQHLEEYCNAQTRLHNILIDNKSTSQQKWDKVLYDHKLQQTTLDLNDCIKKVKSDLIEIDKQLLIHTNNSSLDRNACEALQQHLTRSRRVVQTIFESGGQLHGCGIPAKKGNNDHDSKLVALASLRASRAQLDSYWNR